MNQLNFLAAQQFRAGLEWCKGRLGLSGATAPSNDGWELFPSKERALLQFRKCVKKIQREQFPSL